MTYPLHRYRAFANLSASEERVFADLGGPESTRRRGAIFQREGEETTGFHLLISGWVASSITLRNGDRLIQKVHLPGDMLGTPSMALASAANTLAAITDARTSFVPYARFGALFVLRAQRIASSGRQT